MKKRGAEGSALSLCKGCSDPFPEQLQKEKCDENWKAVQALWREEAEITIVTDLITYS